MKLELSKETAKKIYPQSPDWLKEILDENFGKESLRTKDWKDFKTFEDLCLACGTTEAEFNHKWDPTQFDPSTIAFEPGHITRTGHLMHVIPRNGNGIPGLKFCLPGWVFRIRLSAAITRVRMSVRAFALNQKRRLFTPGRISLNYLKRS